MYKSFEDMPVWQKAMDLAVKVFELTETLPKKEDYGLTSQLRRAALSVSANIAESFGRKHTLDKINFYYHARGSLAETKFHIIYGKRVKYFSEAQTNSLIELVQSIWHEVNKVISGLKDQP